MKIADFFVQITAKGDLKTLQLAVEYQKAIQEQSKATTAHAKVRLQELKKETAEIQKQKKITKKEDEPKTLRDRLIAQGKIFKNQNKINGLIAKGVLQTMGLTGAFMAATSAVIGTAVAIDKMVMSLSRANQLYTNFQRQTGMSIRSAMGVSGAMANVDVTMSPEDVMKNMQSLQSSLVGIQFGMGNIAPYQIAGINPWGMNASNMIDTMRKQMRGLAPQYRTFLLQQMGLDPRLGALIDLSDTEYLKYKQEALELYLSPSDRKAIQNLAPDWNKVNLRFTKVWERITLMLSKDFIGLAEVLVGLFEILTDILQAFNTIVRPLLDILTLILRPIYLLLDDLVGFLMGKDSIIGRALKGDTEGIRGSLGALFGVGSRQAERTKDGLGEFVKFWTKSPLGNIMRGVYSLTNPQNLMFDIGKQFLPIGSTSNTNKNVSMNNDININVGSVSDGQSMVEPLRLSLNSAIAQMVGV